MTLLIHFLMCLTTIFERGVPTDEASSRAQSTSEEKPDGTPEVW